MSSEEAVEALKRLGLPTYEARVFVALQELGSGTAKAVSEQADVPRSQVYGVAESLADRSLVEIVESAPKSYHPVSVSTAKTVLSERLEREQARAFETLEALSQREPDRPSGQDVSTLRGRHPIDERIAALVNEAAHRVVLVAPTESALEAGIEEALRGAARDDVEVTLVTAAPTLRERFGDAPVEVIVMADDNPADFAGRALMVDRGTVLLAAKTEESPVDEEALWTGDSRIGRILAQFMQSGMESGRDRQGNE